MSCVAHQRLRAKRLQPGGETRRDALAVGEHAAFLVEPQHLHGSGNARDETPAAHGNDDDGSEFCAVLQPEAAAGVRLEAVHRRAGGQLEGMPQQAHATTIVLFKAQAVMVPLHALAASTDSQAEQVCERTRSRLADPSANEAVSQQARTSAAFLLASPAK